MDRKSKAGRTVTTRNVDGRDVDDAVNPYEGETKAVEDKVVRWKY